MPPFLARAALLLPLTLFASLAAAQSYSEGGYANRHSVAQGETIAFHVSTSRNPFEIEIVNMASQTTVLQRISGLMSQPRDCSGKWEGGCDWPATTVYTVPTTFVPGYYAARFPTSAGTKHILFVVKPVVLGSYAPIAIIQPTNSDVAYNRFGGKSVYDTISDDGKRAHVVSFNRPYYGDNGFARYLVWEHRFVTWMKAEGRKFEVITDDDMEAGVSLAGYKALVIVGHSEYWSLNARRHLEAYSRAGGHLAIFGANTMWWQVRVNLQTRQMTVYKDAKLDPLTGVDDDLVTTNFTDWPVLNPENSILGASFLNAAYVNKLNSSEGLPVEQRTPYTVRKAQHWSFAGTGLSNGAEMGRSVGAIEVDGALFNTLPNGEAIVEGSDGTPLSYEVLATLPSSDGYATIGFYSNAQGGGVFNGAARDWSYGLAADPVVQTITRNVLDRFATGEPFAFSPRATPNRVEDLFNNPPTVPEFLPGYRFHRFGLNIAPQCAREGPTGLLLAGTKWTQVLRNIAVGRTGLTKAAGNIWINADLLETATFGTPLVSFAEYKGIVTKPVYAGGLEIMIRPEGRAVRVSSFNAAGASIARTAWVVLEPGWNSVQFAWESPGMLELNVAGKKASAANPQAGQKMNAVILEFAGSAVTGSVCADHLQLRDSFAPASAMTSTIEAAPAAIVADGSSTANVVVRLVDAAGHAIVNGGDDVKLTTSLGSLSAVTDAGDGTYTATLTSGATPGNATITGTVNGQPIQDTAVVTLSAPRASFVLDSASTARAGQSVTLTLSVKDADENPATSYRGTVHFTSDSTTSTLPADYTFTASDAGSHTFTATAPSSVGLWTITVADVANSQVSDSVTISVEGDTKVTLSSDRANSSFVGQDVTFTAAITSTATGNITGTVTFKDGSTVLGTAPVAGGTAKLTTSSLSEGTHSITAVYSGGGGFLTSTSNALPHVVRAPRFGAPSGLVASATSASSINVSWLPVEGAARYELFRSSVKGVWEPVANTSGTSFVDGNVSGGKAYLYYARAITASGTVSPDSVIEVALTMFFTDDPLVARVTVIKAIHVTELRSAINALRATAGLAPASFTDASLQGRVLKHIHMSELRDALATARAAAGLSPMVLTGPAPVSNSPVRAAHIQELRDALK